MSDKVCHWDNDDATVIIHNKKAVEACLFLMFIYYTVFVFFTEIKRTNEKGIVFKRYLNDVAYSQIFFFICALMIHTVVPRVFPIVLLYIYMFINFAHPFIYSSGKLVALMVIQILQAILVFIMLIFIMADDWCYFYLYRSYT
eukprot:403341308